MAQRIFTAVAVVGLAAVAVGSGAEDLSAKGLVFEQQATLEGDGGGTDQPYAERGAAVAVEGDTAVVGAPRDDYGGDRSGLVLVYERPADSWTVVARLKPSDPSPEQRFGDAVALSGDTMVVGAPQDLGARGAAYVFVRGAGGWSQQAKLVASNGADGDRFGDSVALVGDALVVGAPRHESAGPFAGTAYVFSRSGVEWTQTAQLTGADTGSGHFFGSAVAVSNAAIAVGAPYATGEAGATGAAYVFVPAGAGWVETSKVSSPADTPDRRFGAAVSVEDELVAVGAAGLGDETGAAYLFSRSGAGWAQTARLVASDPQAGAAFGFSIAVTATTVVVGARGRSQETGAAYVFAGGGASWVEAARLVPGGVGVADYLGSAVALSGTTAIVGAPGHDGEGPSAGAAYAFERQGGQWVDSGKIVAPGSGASDYFGFAIAASGDTAVVAAYADDHSGMENAGSVYVFEQSGGAWDEATKLVSSAPQGDGWFGLAVALQGDVLVVGAHAYDTTVTDSGAAFVFTRTTSGWQEQARLVAADASRLAWFGYSVALDGDTLVVGAEGGSSAYVFERDGDGWVQQAKLAAFPRPSGNPWTSAVAVAGDTVVVGSRSAPGGGGRVSVFARESGSWQLRQVLAAPDGNVSPDFGVPVALTDGALVVGDPRSGVGGAGPGAVYVYELQGSEWALQTRLSLPNHPDDMRFGGSLALAGDQLAVGASGSDGTGAAFVFSRSGGQWVPEGKVLAAGASTGDLVGSAVAISAGGVLVGAAGQGDDAGTRNVGAAYEFVATAVPGRLPLADFSFTPEWPRPGDTVRFVDGSSGAPTAWSWDFGDGSTSVEQSPTHTYLTAGEYTVRLGVSNAVGADSARRQVVVASPPVASFAWSPAHPVPGESVRLVDTSSGSPDTWSWDFGDGGGTGEQSPEHVFAAAGAYDVTLAAGNPWGSDEVTRTITVGGGSPAPEAVIAAVARVQGSGAFFTSRVTLFNPGDEPVALGLEYTARADLGSGTWMTVLELPPGVQVEIVDPLAGWFGFADGDDQVGSLFLRRLGEDGTFLAQSVVFARNPDGTEYGQAFPAVAAGDALQPGEVGYLSTTVDASRYRVNVGVVAVEDVSAVSLVPVDPVGVPLAPALELGELRQGQNRQLNGVDELFDLGTRSDFLVEVRPVGGSVVSYASVLDGTDRVPGTSDPTTVLPVRGGSDTVTLLELGSIQGLDEFAGSASVTSFGSESATVAAELHLRGQPGVAATETFELEPGDTLGFPDLVGEVFGVTGAVGTVVLTTASPGGLSAIGREYAVFRDDAGRVVGTAGQLIPGMTDDDRLEAGATYQLLGLRQSETALGLERSHVAAFNPGSVAAVLQLTLYDGETGEYEGRLERLVLAGELVRVNSVVGLVNPGQDGNVKRLEVSSDQPMFVAAYRVNGNGDPVTIRALRVAQ